jgi:hypothetical protein
MRHRAAPDEQIARPLSVATRRRLGALPRRRAPLAVSGESARGGSSMVSGGSRTLRSTVEWCVASGRRKEQGGRMKGRPRFPFPVSSFIPLPSSLISHPSSFRKSGARMPIWRITGGWGQAEITDVKFGSSAACDPGQAAPSRAKRRSRPSEKRQLPPLSVPILPIFSGFFCEPGREGANWRGFGSQKRRGVADTLLPASPEEPDR